MRCTIASSSRAARRITSSTSCVPVGRQRDHHFAAVDRRRRAHDEAARHEPVAHARHRRRVHGEVVGERAHGLRAARSPSTTSVRNCGSVTSSFTDDSDRAVIATSARLARSSASTTGSARDRACHGSPLIAIPNGSVNPAHADYGPGADRVTEILRGRSRTVRPVRTSRPMRLDRGVQAALHRPDGRSRSAAASRCWPRSTFSSGDAISDDYTHDEALTATPVRPLAVVRPGSTAEVAAIVRVCDELGVPVTARGAGTGLVGCVHAARRRHRAARSSA